MKNSGKALLLGAIAAATAQRAQATNDFDRYGEWHYFALLRPLVRGLLNSASSGNKAARDYWYNDR